MDFTALANIKLRSGNGGGDPKNGLCIMEMVSYFDGADRVTDHPACACPALTAYAIRLNDNAPSQALRDTLKPLLPLLSGSRDPDALARRTEHLVFATARELVAPLFAKRFPKHAAAIASATTTNDLRDACGAAASASASAYVASASASVAAYAASASASVAAYAAASAAAYDAAYAAASAAYDAAYAAASAAAYDAKASVWTKQKQILIEAIDLGQHGALDVASPAFAARCEQLKAAVGVEA